MDELAKSAIINTPAVKTEIEERKKDLATSLQNRKDDQAYFKSNYAMEYLRHQFIVQLRHRIFGPLSADWNFRLTNRLGQYLVYRQAKSTGILQPYGTQGVLDCKIS